MQEIQQVNSEVIWAADRLAGEIITMSRDITRLENRMKIAGSTRTVADVDADLESLESGRSELERRKDELLKRQARLKYDLPTARGLPILNHCLTSLTLCVSIPLTSLLV